MQIYTIKTKEGKHPNINKRSTNTIYQIEQPLANHEKKKANLKIKPHLYESTDDDSETENTLTINMIQNELEKEPPRLLRPLSKRISCE